jgi:hypothetical protein
MAEETKKKERNVFDNISMSVISFLEEQSKITDIVIDDRTGISVSLGASEFAIAKWEDDNQPYKLPEDYKALLQISDGMQLTWKIM